jgi:hypothetical protein
MGGVNRDNAKASQVVRRNTPKTRGLGSLRVSDAIFCMGFAVYIVQYVLLSTTSLSLGESFITRGVLLLMLLKITISAIETRTIQEGGLIVVGLAVFMVILTQINAGTSQLTLFVATLLGARHVRPRAIAKVAFWSILLSVAMVLLLMAMGHLPDAVFIQGDRSRHSLGFTYVGMLDLYLLHLALLAIYLKGGRLHVATMLAFIAAHLLAYSWSVVRGTLAVSLLVWVLFVLCIKRRPGRVLGGAISVIAILWIPVCLGISAYTAIGYQPGIEFWSVVNELFSGRLRLAQTALLTYGITPFGQVITWVGANAVQSGSFASSAYNYVDSGYLQVLIQFGWVTLAVVCTAYMLVAISAMKKHNRVFQIWVIALAVECLIYPNLLLLAYNCLLALAVCDAGDGSEEDFCS